MPTPPTLVQFGHANAAVTQGTAVTTPSLSWNSGDVVVVFASSEGGSSGDTLAQPTTTGSGLSFASSAQQTHQSAGSDCGGVCWAAVTTGASSGTISTTDSPYTGSRTHGTGAYIFRGSAGIGNSAISTGSSRTVSLTMTGADGSAAWQVGDWAAGTVQSYTPATTTHSAASPGPTASPANAVVSGAYTYYVGELDDQTSAGAVSYGIGGSGTGPFTIIAIEAKAAAGAAAVIPDVNMAPIIVSH